MSYDPVLFPVEFCIADKDKKIPSKRGGMLAGGDGERWSDHREDFHKSERVMAHMRYTSYVYELSSVQGGCIGAGSGQR